MAVTTELIHPDAHGANLVYVKDRATGEASFSWCDFGASSMRYINASLDPSERRWLQIKRIESANSVCGELVPAERADMST
mmetsp:Transcript_73227/g.171748  ORF Transcript_73227/g.171748 Transcript_73227/m.171748 type:complete len:81 (+) Transcript_73227:103-345(+)